MKRISWYTSKLPCFVIQQLLVTEALPPEQAADLAHDLAGGALPRALLHLRRRAYLARAALGPLLRQGTAPPRRVCRAQRVPPAGCPPRRGAQRLTARGHTADLLHRPAQGGVLLHRGARDEDSGQALHQPQEREGRHRCRAIRALRPSERGAGKRTGSAGDGSCVQPRDGVDSFSNDTKSLDFFTNTPPPPGESTLGAGLYLP
jgi:hypothetical protein